jgi:hypothetical protein
MAGHAILTIETRGCASSVARILAYNAASFLAARTEHRVVGVVSLLAEFAPHAMVARFAVFDFFAASPARVGFHLGLGHGHGCGFGHGRFGFGRFGFGRHVNLLHVGVLWV